MVFEIWNLKYDIWDLWFEVYDFVCKWINWIFDMKIFIINCINLLYMMLFLEKCVYFKFIILVYFYYFLKYFILNKWLKNKDIVWIWLCKFVVSKKRICVNLNKLKLDWIK